MRMQGAVVAAAVAGCAGVAAALPGNVRVVRAGAPVGGDGRSWAGAFRDLQDALDAAEASQGQVTEIWVAAGVYVPTRRTIPGDARSVTFQLVSGVEIYGGFAGVEEFRAQRNPAARETTLSGQAVTAYHVVTGSGTDSSAVLDGFTVTGGNAAFGAPFGGGGGVLVQVGSPTLVRLKLTGNTAMRGGGAYLDGNATLGQSVIQGNGAGVGGVGVGAWVGPGATLSDTLVTGHSSSATDGGGVAGGGTFVRCRIVSNHADGGGGVFGGGRFIGCTIADNVADAGGGVLDQMDAATATFTDCTISGNRSQLASGGGVSGGGRFVNCLIAGNQSFLMPGGAAIATTQGASATLINCTVVGNSGAPGSPALFGDLTLTNCVVWGNGAGQKSQISGGVVNYSIIMGWTGSLGGVGNSGADPLLTSDWHLSQGSPAVDHGSNPAVPQGEPYDLEGRCRFVDGDRSGSAIVDIGAFELQTCYANCDCSTSPPVLNVSDFVCFMNRFAAGDGYTNCDGSTTAPTLNISDFVCYMNRYAQGCP